MTDNPTNPIIQVNQLFRTYRVQDKTPGFWAGIKSLWNRKYRNVEAVKSVSFTIQSGEIVGFLGPNGAGKTTTLKMLSGLIYPTSGSATVMGYVPWERDDAFRRSFSLVMGQKNQLWWDLPAADSFALHREVYSLEKDRFEKTLGQLTELFGVEKLARQPVRELSLGERMKMELIAALLHEPQVLLLDEPTIGLDVVAQIAIQRCLREYNQSRGATIMLTSHYMKDVEALCERVLVIARGSLIHDGKLSDLMERFGQEKLLKLHFEGTAPPEWVTQLGPADIQGPIVQMRLHRSEVAAVVGRVLSHGGLIDLGVQDPPLEEVIAKLYAEDSEDAKAGLNE
ncbi:MAG: ABC transporter ATP-binding protein [Planctomycetota bacterium]|nr:ABC transporter ATP-binding protein [Planctomycetota bacterium]